jgi:uncharacterized protein YbjT (DUF2867 family)
MDIKVIITGATGMVGEGVLLECLAHPDVSQVLMVNRRQYDLKHPKLKECIIPDFLALDAFTGELSGFNACFFCAGISSIGMNEQEYTRITFDTTLHFAKTLARLNTGMTFIYVSGSHTDSTEKGKLMWARVKGKTENALQQLAFERVYNFRPGFMKPTKGQKNIKPLFMIITKLYRPLRTLFPNRVSTLKQVGLAMINSVVKGYPKKILEIDDINLLAANQ